MDLNRLRTLTRILLKAGYYLSDLVVLMGFIERMRGRRQPEYRFRRGTYDDLRRRW